MYIDCARSKPGSGCVGVTGLDDGACPDMLSEGVGGCDDVELDESDGGGEILSPQYRLCEDAV